LAGSLAEAQEAVHDAAADEELVIELSAQLQQAEDALGLLTRAALPRALLRLATADATRCCQGAWRALRAAHGLGLQQRSEERLRGLMNKASQGHASALAAQTATIDPLRAALDAAQTRETGLAQRCTDLEALSTTRLATATAAQAQTAQAQATLEDWAAQQAQAPAVEWSRKAHSF
jgi:hypothetical protein